MDITEKKIEDMLRNTVFTDSAHKEAVRRKLHSGVMELDKDELARVAGGVGGPGDFRLIDDDQDEWIKW